MSNILLAARLLGLGLALTGFDSTLTAQVAASPFGNPNSNPGRSAADQAWVALAQEHPGSSPATGSGVAPASGAQPAQSPIASYLAYAAKLRAFSAQYPTYPAVTEANRLEALALLHAAFMGDDTQKLRRNQLVATVRKDNTIPAEQRCEVAGYADNLPVIRQHFATPAQRSAAFESVERGLIAEFPEASTPYESLLDIAYARSDDAALAVSRELLTTAAPEWIKQQARILIYRYSLTGKPIHDLVASMPNLQAVLAQQPGRPVLLYTWSLQVPTSVALATKLSTEVPPQVGLIGFNLDSDTAAAAAKVTAAHLRGTQFFNARAMAGMLTMQAPALVFLVDQNGVLASVSAHRNLTSVIGRLAIP